MKQTVVTNYDNQIAEDLSEWGNVAKKRKSAEIIACIIAIIILSVVGILIYRKRVRNLEKEQAVAGIIAERTTEIINRTTALGQEKSTLSENRPKESELSEIPSFVKKRLSMLDSMIVESLTNSLRINEEPSAIIKKLTENPKAFLEDNGKILEVLYPEKVSELKNKGITCEELGLLSLYLMGLSGKEIGALIRRSGHYRINSNIRKKLGLSSNDKNLGNFIKGFFETIE